MAEQTSTTQNTQRRGAGNQRGNHSQRGGFGGGRGRGGDRRRQGGRRKESNDGFDSQLLDLTRVARVAKGGRTFRFRATMITGDGKGKVGIKNISAKFISRSGNKLNNAKATLKALQMLKKPFATKKKEEKKIIVKDTKNKE
ncbi:MAG TPA: hypothetical protein ENI04_00990 [Candidatus Wildermuthbacteria bacterium]|nr:hypothetical protein [Candidatus Wildermuthbacteria bacterium]